MSELKKDDYVMDASRGIEKERCSKRTHGIGDKSIQRIQITENGVRIIMV